MVKFFTGLMFIYIVLLWILGGLLHLWTAYIAFSISGFIGGIISLFAPVISQIFWGFKAWSNSGFESPYIQWLIVLVVMWVVYYILMIIVAAIEKK
jgi:hypothetical protein